MNDLKFIYNKTINWAYFELDNQMLDFPSYCLLMNIMKIFQEGSMNNKGFLNYFNLYITGMTLQTNYILQRYAKLIIKEDTVFNNLKFSLKINNLILYDKTGKFKMENIQNFKGSTKISIDNLFILFRYFELIYFNKIKYPFNFDVKIFDKILQDANNQTSKNEVEICASFLKNTSKIIDTSFEEFKKVGNSAGYDSLEKKDYVQNIFNLIDLNNNTSIEIYELMYLDKIRSIFDAISENGFIMKVNSTGYESMKNNSFSVKLRDYNLKNVYEISDKEIEEIDIVNFFFVLFCFVLLFYYFIFLFKFCLYLYYDIRSIENIMITKLIFINFCFYLSIE
jgi:hypothetical protein